jgi:Fe-S-cluster containining protein
MGKSSRVKKERNFFSKTGGSIFTASLGEVAQQALIMGQENLEAFSQMARQVMTDAIRQLKAYPAGPDRARGVHKSIDDEIERSIKDHPIQSRNISCQKGCAFCCHLQVGITGDEAELLAERVRGGVDIDMTRLQAQAKFPDSAGVWYAKPYSETACVFLGEDKTCRVYEDRPGSCRLHISVDKPSRCDRTTGSVAHTKYVAHRGEMLHSAAMTVSGYKVLPQHLLEKLTGEGKTN